MGSLEGSGGNNMKRGFTLIESLLSVALLALIAFIAAPVYQSFQVRNNLTVTQSHIVDTLRRAQQLSLASEGDIESGIRIETNSIILFRGINYATRDILFDEVSEIPSSIIPSGINEITFTKLKGLPSLTGVITLSSSMNETKPITINEKGVFIF